MDTQRKGFHARGEKYSQVFEEEVPDAVRRLKATFRQVGTPASKAKGTAVQFRPTDIVIAAQRKNGNTWMLQVSQSIRNNLYAKGQCSQIAHGLRSYGDMDFDEISMAVPQLEFSTDYGYGEITKRQKYQPQLYHTHLGYHEIPKGGKYIVIIRQNRI